MFELIVDYLVYCLAGVGFITVVLGSYFIYYESVDRKKAEKDLYK